MFKKSLPLDVLWEQSKGQMLVRCSCLIDTPATFPIIDDNYHTMTADKLISIFDQMLQLPSLRSFSNEDCTGGTKAFFTVMKNPFILHVYIGEDDEISFEFFMHFENDVIGPSKHSGTGLAEAKIIKKVIRLIEIGNNPLVYFSKNATEWKAENDEE